MCIACYHHSVWIWIKFKYKWLIAIFNPKNISKNHRVLGTINTPVIIKLIPMHLLKLPSLDCPSHNHKLADRASTLSATRPLRNIPPILVRLLIRGPESKPSRIILFHLRSKTKRWSKVILIFLRIKSNQLRPLWKKGYLVRRSSVCGKSASKKEKNQIGGEESHWNHPQISR